MHFLMERVTKINEELRRYIYSDRVRINDFQVKEGDYPTIEAVEASEKPWQSFNAADTRWGGRNLFAWFKQDITVPDSFAGKTIALHISTGQEGWDAVNPQFLLYIDGKLVQGLDVNHREVILTHEAKAGQTYKMDLHAYSGMGESKIMLFVELVVLDEKVEKLYYDLKVPLMVIKRLEEDDKKRIDILNILNETINKIDLRKPLSPLFYQSIEEADVYLDEEFYQKMCGSEEVIATCIGHTHIDVAWLWTLSQTRQKTARSFSTVLKLMEEYPEYLFMSSQPQLYKYVKEDHPELYEKIKEKIKEGTWEPEGAMWLEADCNLTSGESLVRQILFGTRFFEKEFGVKNHVLWLPDVFGYSAALPQILKKSDIDYFMTTKIGWNQFNKIPYDTFMWEGIDGTEVLTHFITTQDPNITREQAKKATFTTYNGHIHPNALMGGWDRYQQKGLNNDILIAFGYGDGGGGATKEMLEVGRRMAKGIPGAPTVKMGKVADYFKRLDAKVRKNRRLPKWVGELYLEYHRGTYTSMGRNKKYNRKSEFLYQDAEFLSSLAMNLGKEYPQEKLNEGWETILLNQFHDIIPGSSIEWVYDESKVQYEEVLKKGREAAGEAMSTIAVNIELKDKSLVVYNTLSFNRSDIASFEIPEGFTAVSLIDESGAAIPVQVVEEEGKRKGIFLAVEVPAKGYKTYTLSNKNVEAAAKMTAAADTLDNAFFSIKLDQKGTFTSIYDKVNGRQVLKEGQRGNMLQAFEDKPMNYDNWDIDIFYSEKMWEVDEVEKIEVLENGPVRAGLRIHKKFMDSTIIQDIYMYDKIARVDFKTYVDWKENQVLLKAAFPVEVHANKATYEIQYGNVERSTHMNTSWDVAQFEVCAHKWADVSEDGFGVSLLNDSKYGHDIKDNVMRLTLLKSGMEPNPKADREEHNFVYSIYPHSGDWKEAKTVQMAYNLNVPLYAKVEEAHEGTLPQSLSMAAVDQENVVVEVIKKAEDSEDIIVRMYECYNRQSKVKFTFFKELAQVMECNLMEKELQPVAVEGDSFTFDIKPYEIKTFKLKLVK